MCALISENWKNPHFACKNNYENICRRTTMSLFFQSIFSAHLFFFALFGYLYIERLNCATDLTTLSGNFRVVEP